MSGIFDLIAAGDADAVRALVTRDPAEASARDAEGVSALRRAAYRSRELLEAVLAGSPDIDGFDAAIVGAVDQLEDPAEWSEDGFTPLHLAVFGRHPAAVRALLERGADPNAVARNATLRVRPLHTAAAFGGDTEIAVLLLGAGADPNGRAEGIGFTALHSAAQAGNIELLEVLLAHGADTTARTDDGRTPADFAAEEATAALLRR